MPSIPIIKMEGHIVLEIGDKMAVLDTGASTSMASLPFELFEVIHSPPSEIFGITPEKMSELAGFRIDILIGCDILSTQQIRLRWKDSCLDYGLEAKEGVIASKMETMMGIPIFPLRINNENVKAIFDTGAHLSYINSKVVEDLEQYSEREDFYPIIGRFTASTYMLQTELKNKIVDIEYGVMPDALQMMLGMAMTMSNSSAVIGTQLLDNYDCTISWSEEIISWNPI